MSSGGQAFDAEVSDAEPSAGERFWDQVGPILLAVVLALGIRAVVIESYYVPSGSMLPTMYIGDHVFVSKFSYGATLPLLGWRLPALRDPERGEIVVFALGRRRNGQIRPLDQCPDCSSEGFVKRIVGLPGDTVEYRSGRLILNGERLELREDGETFVDDHGASNLVLSEDLDGCVHQVLDRPGKSGLSQTHFTIPEDRYFLLGDNRDNSNDSRGWGTVHRHDLRGPVLFNYWAWNNAYSWPQMLNPINWIKLLWGEMYWDRIGMTYDCRGDDPTS